MAEPQTQAGTSGTTGVVIPPETQKLFPDLVQLVLNSQSMNNKEKTYWLQVLPVMTEAQVAELRDILETEKRKLQEIRQKYHGGGSGGSAKPAQPAMTDEEREKIERQKREEAEKRKKAEAEARTQENPDDILAQLN